VTPCGFPRGPDSGQARTVLYEVRCIDVGPCTVDIEYASLQEHILAFTVTRSQACRSKLILPTECSVRAFGLLLSARIVPPNPLIPYSPLRSSGSPLFVPKQKQYDVHLPRYIHSTTFACCRRRSGLGHTYTLEIGQTSDLDRAHTESLIIPSFSRQSYGSRIRRQERQQSSQWLQMGVLGPAVQGVRLAL